ncbi:MAG TPA: sodium:calcium antiporter [Candidatus Tectomicrobia bacterium]|nr:sodium:calcium antiporter [Candidatus Tectomicrobia bacterium]
MMEIITAIVFFGVGLGLILFFAEQLVKAAVGTSVGFGVSTFLISVVFIGFDPENLAVGAVAASEAVPGIALGSIIGAAMVAIALAFGITALVVPMRFDQVPSQILAVPILAVLLLAGLASDGRLSRLDGVILLSGFVLALLYLARLGRRGLDIRPSGEVAETLERAETRGRWAPLALLLLSLAAIVAGSELLVSGARTLLSRFGIAELPFGMTILAFLISIEELARELPAAWRGRPEISFGNVVGSILAFFLCNGGVIALVHPVVVERPVLLFYLPLAVLTTVIVSGVMWTTQVARWAGGLFVMLYAIFVIGGWLI